MCGPIHLSRSNTCDMYLQLFKNSYTSNIDQIKPNLICMFESGIGTLILPHWHCMKNWVELIFIEVKALLLKKYSYDLFKCFSFASVGLTL